MAQGILVDFPKIAFDRMEKEVRTFLRGDALSVVGVEAMRFIQMNFDKQGFMTSRGLDKWQKRKRPASMYYKRGRRVGQLTSAGRAYMKKKNRPLFSSSSGGLMRNSFDYSRRNYSVKIYSHLPYAFFHNYGTERLPRRMFIGPSDYLHGRISSKINREVHQQFGSAYKNFKTTDFPLRRDIDEDDSLEATARLLSDFDWEVGARYATKDNARRLLTGFFI